MVKNGGKPGRRAYVNPIRGFDEKQQRAFIEKHLGEIDEWYVEGRSVKRIDFIESLRAGDEAIVARTGCLAEVVKDRQRRMADLLEARGDINQVPAVIVSAEGLRSDKHWPKMKEAAKAYFRWTAQVGNASARALTYTDTEIEAMLLVRVDKRFKNDDERLAAIGRKKIRVPGRTWLVEKLPIVASERGITI